MVTICRSGEIRNKKKKKKKKSGEVTLYCTSCGTTVSEHVVRCWFLEKKSAVLQIVFDLFSHGTQRKIGSGKFT